MNLSLLLNAINAEDLGTGGIIVLLGVLAVFFILGLLIAVLKLISPLTKIEYTEELKKFFKKIFSRKKSATDTKAKAEEANGVNTTVVSADANAEVVAAIMATISMLNANDNSDNYEKQATFVVRSIKQIR